MCRGMNFNIKVGSFFLGRSMDSEFCFFSSFSRMLRSLLLHSTNKVLLLSFFILFTPTFNALGSTVSLMSCFMLSGFIVGSVDLMMRLAGPPTDVASWSLYKRGVSFSTELMPFSKNFRDPKTCH
ncbi:hypothetical protein L9F63_006695 [Diploptera punctata]|uniref:Uncharacterized protein n=1 Tax=Diploptera punctata TaxID=6984 RepID=A0AAD7ZA94_DIPPU|nr:hypothetical protein L9F63_006695 [Diploptera punctata]